MNVEERVKEYVKDLQRHIKANILDGSGRVRHAISRQGSPIVTRFCSFPSQAWLVPSDRCSPRRRGNINPRLRQACLRMVPWWIELRTMSYLSWLAHLLSFRSVSVSVSVRTMYTELLFS